MEDEIKSQGASEANNNQNSGQENSKNYSSDYGQNAGQDNRSNQQKIKADNATIANNSNQPNNTLSILSLVFSFVFAPIGLVLGIIALAKKQSKGLAISGIVISTVGILFTIVIFLLAISSVPSQESTNTSTKTDNSVQKNEPSKQEEPGIPTEYKSALAKADSYANNQNMSKKRLYDQLTSEYGEQFTTEAAQYAVDNVKADWNANALAKAKSYQKMQNMSPARIHDQLTSEYGEQFTTGEADYAIAHLDD